MKLITFDISIRPDTIQGERQRTAIAALDEVGLRQIGKGKLFIVFAPQRDYIAIDTELLDYLDQIRGVINQIDGGNHRTFTVSRDYYSNGLSFIYDAENKTLEIEERKRFKIETRYKDFRAAFLKFFPEAIADFVVLYPELLENQAFCEKFFGEWKVDQAWEKKDAGLQKGKKKGQKKSQKKTGRGSGKKGQA